MGDHDAGGAPALAFLAHAVPGNPRLAGRQPRIPGQLQELALVDRAAAQLEVHGDMAGYRCGGCQRRHVLRAGLYGRAELRDVGEVSPKPSAAPGYAAATPHSPTGSTPPRGPANPTPQQRIGARRVSATFHHGGATGTGVHAQLRSHPSASPPTATARAHGRTAVVPGLMAAPWTVRRAWQADQGQRERSGPTDGHPRVYRAGNSR